MHKKKLLLLSSYGGYGHIAAANTIISLLGNEYSIEVIYPIKELRICGLPSGENFYNFLISNNWNRFTNWIVKNLSYPMIRARLDKMMNQIEAHVREKKPDMVISLIPFANYPASEAARKHHLPFLMVTTDGDLANWVFSLEKRKHTNVKVTIGSDTPFTRGRLVQHGIPDDVIETVGLPLRPRFLNVKPKKELRKEYNIPEGKPVVLIMMGGAGGRAATLYTREIVSSDLNVHLLICTGKKKKLAATLKAIETSGHTTFDVIPFTEKVEDLYGVADLVLTKPGPGSINEAFALKLPILIDRTGTPLFWEQANIDLVLNHKVGVCIHNLKEASHFVKHFLFDEQIHEAVRRSYEEIPLNTFTERIGPLIDEMCQEPIPGEVMMTSRTYDPRKL